MKANTIVLLVFIPGICAMAQNEESNCFPKSVGTSTYSESIEMMKCLSRTRSSLDAELNELFQRVDRRLRQGLVLDRFHKTQHLWISYKDAACKDVRDLMSAAPQDSVQLRDDLCVIRMTRERIADIADIKGTYALDDYVPTFLEQSPK